MPECYRHPGRETGVSCSRCGRPICPECMTPTPVGMRCPECSKERTRVVSGTGSHADIPRATYALIALNVIVFLAEIATGAGGFSSTGGTMIYDFGLFGPSVADGEWYRILTAGFLHAGLIHIGFNMYALYILGRILEPGIGTPRFVVLYFVSLLAGSFGALLLSGGELTVGASGAIFGTFGATFVIARGRGLGAVANSIGLILLINLALTFGISGISVGGHLGGLAAGLICGMLIIAGERGWLGPMHRAMEYATMIALGLLAIAGSVAVA